jgi:hypothetical protein
MTTEPGASDISETKRMWRMRILFGAPTTVPMPAGGGLPAQLTFVSRVLEQARAYDDVAITIQAAPPEALPAGVAPNPQFALSYLIADVVADDPHSAVIALASTIESIIDLMSFEMGTAIPLGQTEAIDVTEPVALGDEREIMIFSGSPFDRNIRQVEMQAIQGLLLGRLPDLATIPDSKVAAALRWFVKSLETVLLHDQFIFLWIALEILSDRSGRRVEEPYKGPCQHEIPNCPECGRATSQMVRGGTLRNFLQEFGASVEDASALWRMRQLMHGAIPFDSNKLEALPALAQSLRAAVVMSLKESLGWEPSAPPLVAPSGLSIHPTIGVGGTRAVKADDISSLAPESQAPPS